MIVVADVIEGVRNRHEEAEVDEVRVVGVYQVELKIVLDEIDRLQAIVAKLHKTITLGSTVYCRMGASIEKGTVTSMWLRDEDGLTFVNVKYRSGASMKLIGDCYSTRAAAEAAGGE